tara:strand:- start:145 stop:300 length:156 start_codon:yes stop_codon:yes gene_type:complete
LLVVVVVGHFIAMEEMVRLVAVMPLIIMREITQLLVLLILAVVVVEALMVR